MQVKQRTIKKEISLTGKSLQTGKRSVMICRPALSGEGISFTRSDITSCPKIKLSDGIFSESGRRRTQIGFSGVKLQTLEHFMGALWALGIDNLEVEVSASELPAMDGSALGFLEPLRQAGIEEQESPRKYIKVDRPIRIADKERTITVLPAEKFSVSYTIDYPVQCIKNGTFSLALDGDTFEREIAPARTFCMKKEAVFLFFSGLGRGATFENTLILGDKGPVRTKFRFLDEPVRHKVLDLVGDLYMLGVPVIAEFICERSGHALNARVLREIYSKYVRQT